MVMPGRKRKSDNPDEADRKPRTNRVPLPSNNPATNLLIAEIVVRGAASLLRRDVEKRVVKASGKSDEEARQVVDGRTLLTSLGLYGASRLATRSVGGLMVVTGGLVAKTLYDRGKAYQSKKRRRKSRSKD